MKHTQAAGAVPPAIERGARVPALDGLRGGAILGVLLFHTGHLPGGFLGVDLFFALSGYLITDLLLREIDRTGTISPVAFWGRRSRRLLPALAVMLGVVTVVVWVRGTPDLLRTAVSDGPWVQLNLINWHLLADSVGYWDRFGQGRVFEHLWSIAVEEQFYLLWPILVLFLTRLGKRADRGVAVFALGASVVSLLLMIVLLDPADPSRVYTGTDTRTFSLLLGAVAATTPARALLARVPQAAAGAVLTFLAAVVGVLWWQADGVDTPWLFTGGLFAHSLAAALLIGVCAQAGNTVFARVLSWPPLRWLGLISYSLYLWHWPVSVLLSESTTGLGEWPRTALVFAVSIGLAALSKQCVEDPIRFRAKWAKGRSGWVAFVAVTAVLALLWLLVPAPEAVTVDVTDLT